MLPCWATARCCWLEADAATLELQPMSRIYLITLTTSGQQPVRWPSSGINTEWFHGLTAWRWLLAGAREAAKARTFWDSFITRYRSRTSFTILRRERGRRLHP